MGEKAPLNAFPRFFREMKKRKVFRVITVYAGVSFVILQVCDLLVPALNLPEWTLSLVFVLLAIGFFIAVTTAWAFEITPDGVVRITDSEEAKTGELPHGGMPFTGNRVIISLMAIVIGLLVYPLFLPSGETDQPTFNPRLGPKSIAVLPFTYLANEDSADYFSLGMTDELLSNLAKVKNLSVIARTSVMQYQNTDKTIQEIGEELGVAHLLEGSVQVVGGRVRIQAQLIEAANGTHTWADSYTYPFENILDLQSRVTREIVRELEINLLPGEDARLRESPRVDPVAYQLYLQGRYLRFQENVTSLERSIELLRESINRDPDFAPAHAVLSVSALNLWFPTGLDTLIVLSSETAERALQIDSLRAEVQIAAGLNQGYVHKNYRAGVRHLLRAVQLNPGLSNAHRECGLLLTRLGLFEQALPYLQKAVDLDPVSVLAWNSLADNYIYRGMINEAQDATRKVLDLNPNNHGGLDDQVFIYLDQGENTRALELIKKKVLITSDRNSYGQLYAAYLYLKAGEKEEAEKLIQQYGLVSVSSAWANYNWARLHIAMGNDQPALRRLEMAVEENIYGFPHSEPEFEPIRNDPDFQELLKRMGLDNSSIEEYRELVQRLNSNS